MTKKLGICIDLTETSVAQIKRKLEEMNFSDVSEIHLLHGFQKQVYVDNFFFTQFPFQDQMEEVKKSVLEVLTDIEESIKTNGKIMTIVKECLIADLPKKEIADYVKENNLDQLIVATRGKHGIEGLFSSSFAEYMVRHVDSELLIIRC